MHTSMRRENNYGKDGSVVIELDLTHFLRGISRVGKKGI